MIQKYIIQNQLKPQINNSFLLIILVFFATINSSSKNYLNFSLICNWKEYKRHKIQVSDKYFYQNIELKQYILYHY
jgi:hypothetical protein